jgi:hypothetical protein
MVEATRSLYAALDKFFPQGIPSEIAQPFDRVLEALNAHSKASILEAVDHLFDMQRLAAKCNGQARLQQPRISRN